MLLLHLQLHIVPRLPAKPLIERLHLADSSRRKPAYSEFAPGQPFRHFLYLYLNKLPQSHILLHSCFCRDQYCVFHG